MKEQKKEESTKSNITDFEDQLKSFVSARDKASENLVQLRSRIRGLEVGRDSKQQKLNDAIKDIIDGKSTGKTTNESALDLKKEIAAMESLITTLQTEGIPQAEKALREANTALVEGLKVSIISIKSEVQNDISSHLQTINQIVNNWTEYLTQLLPTLGLMGLSWFEKEGLYRVISIKDRHAFEKLNEI